MLNILVVLVVLMVSDVIVIFSDHLVLLTGSIPLSPLSYNTIGSNVFNGTQPSIEGCTTSTEGQLTIDCGQGTTLIDCDQGGDYSDLSHFFTWSRTASGAQQVSIVFRFNQQINISNISMFFWNSPSNSIIVPDVSMAWADHNLQFINTTITTNSPNRTKDGQSRLNIYNIDDRLKYQYLRIMMSFYHNNEWIFLSEVQFCGKCVASYGNCDGIKCCVTGNTAPFHITQPSVDNYVYTVSTTVAMVSMTCSLNITIPSTTKIQWLHNNTGTSDGLSHTGNTATLLIRNFQSSDVGNYQCIFNDALSGWTIRRLIRLFLNGTVCYEIAIAIICMYVATYGQQQHYN